MADLVEDVAGQPCPANYGDFIATGIQSGGFTKYSNDTGYVHNPSLTAEPVNQSFNLSDRVFFNNPASDPTMFDSNHHGEVGAIQRRTLPVVFGQRGKCLM